MRVAVVVFPGTNCDQDVVHVYRDLLGCTVHTVWHRDEQLGKCDLVVLPGGFSYGDYLRTGALAKVSPIMKAIRAHAERGALVLGICNGFQILCEAGLLPGALLQNVGQSFLSQFVHLRVERSDTFFTRNSKVGAVLCCPIAHGEGNYFCYPEELQRLEDSGQVVFRYCGPDGRIAEDSNPNGSLHGIAGVCNAARNVVGLMPHPERSVELLTGHLGGDGGRMLFEATLEAVTR